MDPGLIVPANGWVKASPERDKSYLAEMVRQSLTVRRLRELQVYPWGTANEEGDEGAIADVTRLKILLAIPLMTVDMRVGRTGATGPVSQRVSTKRNDIKTRRIRYGQGNRSFNRL